MLQPYTMSWEATTDSTRRKRMRRMSESPHPPREVALRRYLKGDGPAALIGRIQQQRLRNRPETREAEELPMAW